MIDDDLVIFVTKVYRLMKHIEGCSRCGLYYPQTVNIFDASMCDELKLMLSYLLDKE